MKDCVDPCETGFNPNCILMIEFCYGELNQQTEQNVRVDLTDEPKGIYMIQLLGNNFNQMQKVIKH